ncbi:hypothetical protein AOLI_G00073540 [Acnodon oligacanthus]
MASATDALRRQRRRELDARRSKSRIRLGSCLESWGQLKETLGFSLHSELAQYLLDSYFSKVCSRCSGEGMRVNPATFFTTAASIQKLMLLVHSHSQQCPLPPSLQPGGDPTAAIQTDPKGSIQMGSKTCIEESRTDSTQADPKAIIQTDPNIFIQPDPQASVHAGSKASMQTDLNASIEAERNDSIQAGNNNSRQANHHISIQADPQASIKADPKASIKADPKASIQANPKASIQADPKKFTQAAPNTSTQAHMCLKYVCRGGHVFTWYPMQTELEVEDAEGGEGRQVGEQGDAAYSGQKGIIKRGKRGAKDNKIAHRNHKVASSVRTRSSSGPKSVPTESTVGSKEKEGPECVVPDCSGDDEDPEQPDQSMASPTESDAVLALLSSNCCAPLSGNEMDTGNCEKFGNENPESKSAVPNISKRGRQRRADPSENIKAVNLRQQSVKNDVSQIRNKRKRKAAPKLILPCEFTGCWKIFSSRQYLNHHMKYQHFQQKTFTCSHPSCGKSFNFKKHLKEHEKLHSDQKDYICEFCARAFRTSSNLSIHRRIHTGEKPLQCEVCGFTCRQKASLNWHMRKHDAESGYQFPCEICGRRFEKRDNVTAHRSKSHPEHVTASMDKNALKPAGLEGDTLSLPKNL